MTLDDIKASLTPVLQGTGLILQVKQNGPQFVMMLNCPKTRTDANFQEAASLLIDQLAVLDPPNISSIKLYGRREGVAQPEWQQTYAFPPVSTTTPEVTPMVKKSSIKTFVSTKKEPSKIQSVLGNLQGGFQLPGLLVPALLAGILLTQLITVMTTAFVREKPAPVQWEYRVESVPDVTFTESMNSYGAGGWELVFARRAQDSITEEFSYECIFKRLVTEKD